MTTDVYASLEALSKEEGILSQKVDKLLSNAGDLSRSLQRLDLLRVQSQSLQVSSSYLLSTLQTTASTAERISSNVRGLDSEQSRVKETLKYVEEVKELKACVLGVHHSMEAQDWEVAAEFVHRASLVPDQIARGKFAALMVPTAETPLSPAETIREASDQLYFLFTRQFREAAKARDTRQITRFFKLFPQIDKCDEGLDLYASFVSSIIAERADQAINIASTSPILYANLMSGLFENIAKLITNHTPLITRFYGKDIDRVLAKVQEECDRQGILILTTLSDDRQVNKKVSEIKSYSFSFLVQSFLPTSRDTSHAPEEREVDSKALDALLSEISIIFARWSLYTNFLKHCSTANEPTFITNNALSKYLNTKVESNYETMEAYFMRRSVERAFQLESIDTTDTGQQISSIVDDVMFILRKVTMRALSTCRIGTTTSIFAVVRRILEQDYAGVLGRRMQELQGRIAGPKTAVIRSADLEKRDRLSYIQLLNTLDLSTDYVFKIVAEHRESQALSSYEDRDAVLRVIEVLATLTDRFSRGLEEGIAVLYNTYVKSRIRNMVNDIFVGSNYLLTQSTFEDSHNSLTFRQKLVTEWNALIVDSFESSLTASAHETLLKTTVRAFVRVLEKKLLTIKCSELGAIKLDKDISTIISHVARDHHGIRDRFERVREISSVVNWSVEDSPENGADDNGVPVGGVAVGGASGNAGDGQGAEIVKALGLLRIGVEEVEMIRREMMVHG